MRSAPGAAPAGSSGNDPLAELARLIGQNDPFAEYGRENARRAAPAQAEPAPAAGYADERYAAPDSDQPQSYGAVHGDAYQARAGAPGYPPQDAGYAPEAEYPSNPQSGAEQEDFYDDVQPRRRMGIMAIAAVFALAVVGTAGAFGYRALFGSSGTSGPPPVIKADATPTKIVPAANSKDPKSGKLIYDRVADRAQGEKLVSREEQPMEMKDKPTGVVMPQGQPALGSGVIATEPKKVHTIAIRPDGSAVADAAPMAASVAAPAPVRAPAPAPVAAQAPARAPAAEVAPRQAVTHSEPPTSPPPPRAAAPVSNNAPLSLSPDAPAPAQTPAAPVQRPMRAAAAAAPAAIAPPQAARTAPSGNGGGYAVQVSAQRSEADAQTAFRTLQGKFPSQLGGKQPLIHRVDLGAKGIYFRAMVGPFGSSEEAGQLCSNLKAAGGDCIVQRN